MDKLELKYLCGYLPYGLDILENGHILRELRGINIGGGLILSYNGIGEQNCDEDESEFKPLLLPLSALTEPLADGSIPIVELARIRDKTFRVCNYGYSEDDGYFVSNGLYHKFGFINNSFYTYFDDNTTNEGYCEINNQLQFFEYLYSIHADVYGLIDAGLAIDKRTIKI